MSPSVPSDAPPSTRPVVSDVERGPNGRQFTIRFEPGQRLPAHTNPARIVITAVSGSGDITVAGYGMRYLPAGGVVQIDPEVEHAVVAGEYGLELLVRFVPTCCERC